MGRETRIARAVAVALCAAVLAVVLVGCAIDKGANGQLNFKLDEAELFGTKVATFALNSGEEGTLRLSNGRYSIKLRDHLKIIPLGGATVAKILRADMIDDRTVVLVEKAERGCNYKYTLLSIRGAEILSWDFGDCNTQPLTALQANQVTYDFARNTRLTRFTYRDSRLVRADMAVNAIPIPASQESAPTRSGNVPTVLGDGYIPDSPSTTAPGATAATTVPKPERAATTTASTKPLPAREARPSARPAMVAALPAQKPLNFPAATEQTPIRIVLDK